MFQLFLRARAPDYFKSRSATRDETTDQARLGNIIGVIEGALTAAEGERAGLNRRIEDVLARAAITLGNGTDEYLERDAVDSQHQDAFDAEIKNGQRRLAHLDSQIEHLKFLKTTVIARFPGLESSSSRPTQ